MKRLIFVLIFLLLGWPVFAGGYLQVSTATTININLVKTADGTGLTGATVTNISAQLCKQSDTSSNSIVTLTVTASGGSNDAVEKGLGVYNLELSATDTNTLGRLDVTWAYANCYTLTDSYEVIGEPGYTKNITGSDVSLQDLFDFGASYAGATPGSWGSQLITNLWAPVFSTNPISDATGVPSWPMTPDQILARLGGNLFNKVTVTNTTKTFYDSNDTAQSKQTLSDDGTTFTQTKQAAPQ